MSFNSWTSIRFSLFVGFRFLTLQISFLSVEFRFLTLQISFHFVGFRFLNLQISFLFVIFCFLTLQISFPFVGFRFLTLQISLDFVFASFRFVSFRFVSFLNLPVPRRQKLYFWIFKATNPDIKTYVAEVLLLTFFLNITNLMFGELVSMIASNAVDRELEP